MTDIDTLVCKHVETVTRMLLGNRRMKPGVAITGGAALDIQGRVALGQMAVASETDVVHLGFGNGEPGLGLADITIFVPRERGCAIQPGCQLWLPKSGNRALLLPQPHVRGHFRLSPRELIHLDRKPSDTEAGIERANQRFRSLDENCF